MGLWAAKSSKDAQVPTGWWYGEAGVLPIRQLDVGHAAPGDIGTSLPSRSIESCWHSGGCVLTECHRFPCGSFEPPMAALGRAGTSSEAAWRARCAAEQPIHLGPHLPGLSPCACDGCLMCCHRIHTASCSSISPPPGKQRISPRSSRAAACDERHARA